ncbi:GumC family protein [Phocaeicola paurosaccharolyticus]|uniref:GumC family protein n=1 Tax=Phocaeicola paurosaccharolyticus TaxID=732242 RepID=UPI000468F649|nr:hypothetical protein [Phocaeicola paurosaccharolyticus]
MEQFKYIISFFYRIRWWIIIVPILVGIFVWIITRNTEKNYDVKTTIYTGIISGYNVDQSDYKNANVHLSNLINIITTERTLKAVSLKLLTRCLIYGDAEKNTSYITAEHFNILNQSIPRELRPLIDKQDEEKTYNRLVAFERPSVNNFIYQLLNYNNPYFSIASLSEKIKVSQLGNSDMIEIGYSANDPGITYNTLDILNEEFVKQYRELRYGETNNVIQFFREELARLGSQLTSAEDSLIEYNIEHRIINFEEQTKQVTILDAAQRVTDNDLLINSTTSSALTNFYENKLGEVAKRIKNSNEFLDNINRLSTINNDLYSRSLTNNTGYYDKLNRERDKTEENMSNIAKKISSVNSTTDNIPSETLVDKWLEQVVLNEKTKSQMQAQNIMREKLDEDFVYYSPIGATLNRKERNIGFVESNYMSIMGALNQAILRQKNLEMTAATLKVMNPPLFPLNSSSSNSRMVVLTSMLAAILFIIGYFLIIEILDHTLRDKTRAERLTGGGVIGAFPQKSSLRYRRYNKSIESMAIKNLSTNILPYLSGKKRRIINLFSTEHKDGKTNIAKALEFYWNSIGLNVRRITYEEDFLSEDSEYIEAKSINDICKDIDDNEIIIVEFPILKDNPISPSIINEASLNLLVVRANRTWKNTDQRIYDDLSRKKDDEVPLFIYLTQANRSCVEDFTGQLPPYTSLKNLEYKLSQLGLTSTDYVNNEK